MSNREFIERRENLEAEIKVLRIIEEQLYQMQSNCKHEIVIVLYRHNSYDIDAVCLFCGRKFDDPRSLRDCGEVIDMSNYKFRLFMRPNKKYEIVRKKYLELDNENLEIKEIVKMIEEELKKEDEEFKLQWEQGLIEE